MGFRDSVFKMLIASGADNSAQKSYTLWNCICVGKGGEEGRSACIGKRGVRG